MCYVHHNIMIKMIVYDTESFDKCFYSIYPVNCVINCIETRRICDKILYTYKLK